jgi:hypothetical protein
MLTVRLFVLVLLFGSLVCTQAQSASGQADNPGTILVSRFNFVRPANWKWADTRWEGVSNVLQSVTFRVDEDDANGDCSVYINHFVPDRPAGGRVATANRWKDSFTDVPAKVAFGKPETIGTNKVSYLEISGTYKSPGKNTPLRKNFSMYGAVIDDPAGNVVLRVMGNEKLVRKAKPQFKKMIEDALKQE